MAKDKLINQIKSKHRLTSSRLDIIECLQDEHHSHTINDIIKHIEQKNKHVNVTSVYNNINLLIKEGIIDVYPDYKSKNQLYEIVDKSKLHIHLYCPENDEEKRYLLPEDIKQSIIKLLDKNGYEYQNIKVEILAKKK